MNATNQRTIDTVVIIIGLLALACVGGVIALAATTTPIPSTLEVTTGTTVGGLLTLLVSTRTPAAGAAAPVDQAPEQAPEQPAAAAPEAA